MNVVHISTQKVHNSTPWEHNSTQRGNCRKLFHVLLQSPSPPPGAPRSPHTCIVPVSALPVGRQGCAQWTLPLQIMLEGVGTRGSDTEQVPSDGGNKRRKLDRAGGAVLPWHAVPLQPDERTRRRQPRCDDHGRHHLVTRNVMASTDREWLLKLQQRMQPDQLDCSGCRCTTEVLDGLAACTRQQPLEHLGAARTRAG